MAKCRVVVRPAGLINGREWPEVGKTIDLPKVVAEDMAAAGSVELIAAEKKAEKTTEKRPASQAGVEKRAAEKS